MWPYYWMVGASPLDYWSHLLDLSYWGYNNNKEINIYLEFQSKSPTTVSELSMFLIYCIVVYAEIVQYAVQDQTPSTNINDIVNRSDESILLWNFFGWVLDEWSLCSWHITVLVKTSLFFEPLLLFVTNGTARVT